MYPIVKQRFMWFTEQFEGAIRYMFLDIEGRVGTAYGIDLDADASGRQPLAVARSQGLPKARALVWRVRGTSDIASTPQIDAEWDLIKSKPSGKNYGFGYYKQFTTLELSEGSMKKRVEELLDRNEQALKRDAAFRDLDSWPADAQLAVMGLAWNGVGHLTGNGRGTLANPAAFRDACQRKDFTAAAELCQMQASYLARRSQAQKDLLLNAATVVAEEGQGYYQKQELYWPTLLL